MAARQVDRKCQNLVANVGGGDLPPKRANMAEGGEQKFAPLTVNTQSLETFGLGPNYQDFQPIGFGVHGLVVSAVDKVKNHRVAAKKIKVESQISCRYALREIKLLCQLKHENIIKVLDVLFDGGRSLVREKQSAISNVSQIYIITELLDTNLNVLIAQNLLEAEHIKLITYQLLRGLHYLNSANVIHRDLKPSNLFVNCDTLLLKIGDFGLARIVDTTYNHAGHLTADLGTYWYRAPELMISPSSYSAAVDMWSAGCILAEMLLGKPVFTGANDVEQLRVIIDSVNLTERDWSAVLRVLPNKLLHHHPLTPQHPLSHRLDNLDPAVTDLLEDMLVFDPQNRGTPGEALAHPYLQAYAKPDKEPIVAAPFRIESEVDDLPAPELKKMIFEESKKRRGRRGLRIPAPSPIDRPKVSSATLNLKLVGDSSKKSQVPSSPIDNLVKEHRRNRRSRLSTSVDLSFISLPSPGSSPEKKASSPDTTSPQKAVYSTKGFQSKPSPPCPWKWPSAASSDKGSVTNAATSSIPSSTTGSTASSTAGSTISSIIGDKETTPSSADTQDTPQSDEILFQHKVVPPPTEVQPVAQAPESMPAPKTGVSVRREARIRAARRRKEDTQASSQMRTKTKKRGFVDVGGFDEEDFIHLGLSSGTTVDSRRASDSMAMGGIESYTEKNQAAIDRELNRRNKSGSIDMTSTKIPHLQYTSRPQKATGSSHPAKHKLESDSGAAVDSNSRAPITDNTSKGKEKKSAPVITMLLQSPESTIVPLTLASADEKKRGSDVGIKIIKSPRSQRRVTCLGFEQVESPSSNSPERRWSSAAFDRSSPIYLPERKVSFGSLAPPNTNKVDLRKNSASSDIGTSRSAPSPPISLQHVSYSDDPMHKRRGRSNFLDFTEEKDASLRPSEKARSTTPQLTGMHQSASFTFDNSNFPADSSLWKSSNEIPEVERILLASEPPREPIEDPPCGERPDSVLSTLSIPMLSPPSEFANDSKNLTRKVSSTTLFIENFSVSQENGKKSSDSRNAEPSRCSSSLSIDLSCYVNKEQIKGDEEEKDQAEVSPRKQQEDWEIESQSSQSQKSEYTLSEIIGVEDNEDQINELNIANQPSVHKSRHSSDNGASKVCRAEIDIIPYRAKTPEIKLQYCTFSPAPQTSSRRPSETGSKSPVSKFEQLSLDRDRKSFTSEFKFVEKDASCEFRPNSRGSGAMSSSELESMKDELLINLPTTSPTVPPGFPLDMPRVPLLGIGKLTQHKSEEDLVNPRAFPPRSYTDVQSSKGPGGRDPVDLSDFKQSMKENLSSLKVSIPKDLPEKRRLVKAHSTESVCSEGEATSSYRNNDNPPEDLMQFSPMGEAGGNSLASSISPAKDSSHDNAHCNHCFYPGDCPSLQALGMERETKDSECFSSKAASVGDGHEKDRTAHVTPTARSLPPMQNRPHVQATAVEQGAESTGEPLDEMCLSKDLFNERQKMKSCDTLNQSGAARQENGQGSQKKARPKSAKN